MRENGNAMTVVLVLAVLALAGFIAYQQLSSNDEPQDIDINVPKMSPTPISSPIPTNPPATMTPAPRY